MDHRNRAPAELADRVQTLQVEALCWCGARATHNARTVDGKMVTEGEQVVVGDVGTTSNVAYEVLCRRHHMRNVTAKVSNPAAEQSLRFWGGQPGLWRLDVARGRAVLHRIQGEHGRCTRVWL